MSNAACSKVLVLAYGFSSSTVQPRLPLGCGEPLDPVEFLKYVRLAGGTGTDMKDRFVTVPRDVLRRMRVPAGSVAGLRPFVNQAPRLVSMTGNGTTYILRVSDPNGWQDLKVVHVLLRGKDDELARRLVCAVAYSSSRHFIWNDTKGSYVVRGHSNVLRAPGCTLDVGRTVVEAEGDTLTLSIHLQLTPELLQYDPLVLAARVEDLDGTDSGWTSIDHRETSH